MLSEPYDFFCRIFPISCRVFFVVFVNIKFLFFVSVYFSESLSFMKIPRKIEIKIDYNFSRLVYKAEFAVFLDAGKTFAEFKRGIINWFNDDSAAAVDKPNEDEAKEVLIQKIEDEAKHDAAKKIETDLSYPGQIKVIVIRETRVIATAQ